MSIYDIHGNTLLTAYNNSGQSLTEAYSESGDRVFPSGTIQLRVMTYNVGQWYIGIGEDVPADLDSAFYALQNGIIESNNPDVLVIQEYSKEFSKTGRTSLSMLQQYYPYVEERDGTGAYGHYLNRCICSKYPISNYTVRTYSNDVNRYYDSCVINVNGIQVTFVDTHFDAFTSSKRIAQATQLFNFVKTVSGNFIICGDLNNALKYPFSEENAAIYNQFLNYGCTIVNDGEFGIFHSSCGNTDWVNSSHAIDNIIVSPRINIDDVWTDLTKITNTAVLNAGKIDHVPLITDLSLSYV